MGMMILSLWVVGHMHCILAQDWHVVMPSRRVGDCYYRDNKADNKPPQCVDKMEQEEHGQRP